MSTNTDWLDLAELDSQQRWRLRPPQQFPSPWACEWGFDQYGLWQSFKVKDVTCKMRYISHGSFLMGSPETEAERFNYETQHSVTLTQSFWLAETTVSQRLWQAVMGSNPSKFKDEQGVLPVEQVSWDDCQQFCQQLNQLVPQLQLALPTEAQWEYACRAGTQTPFSTGQQLTTEQANYNGNYPYHQGEKSEFRQTTVAVDSFAPNQWGLYQMHGNVWEWCRDSWQAHGSQPTVNPLYEDDKPGRVVRGGSWVSNGRSCRAAFRDHDSRVDAGSFIGLRVLQVDPAGE